MDTKKKNHAIGALRKASYAWKPRSISKAKSRVKVGEFSTGKAKFLYMCAACANLFKEKETVQDHILPVVPVEGFKNGMEHDFNEYIDRLYADESNWQTLCRSCHDLKTKEENKIRRANKIKEELE